MIRTFCPGWTLPFVPEELEGGRGRNADSSRLLEGEVGWLLDEVVLSRPGVLSEGARAPAEDLVARTELRDTAADRLDRSCNVRSGYAILRLPKAGGQAHDPGRARHQDPVADMDGRRMNPDEDLGVRDLGLVDGRELEHIVSAIRVLSDCLHVGPLFSGHLPAYGVRLGVYGVRYMCTMYAVNPQSRNERWRRWPSPLSRARSPAAA